MLRVVVSALLFLSAFSYARADAATPADWRLFLDRSYRDYWSATDPVDFEDMLYAAAEQNSSQDAAVAAFAGRIGVPIDAARRYADFIVDAVKLRVFCEEPATRKCDFAPGARFYERVVREGMAEPTGALMIVAAKNLRDSSSQGAHYAERRFAHPPRGPPSRRCNRVSSPLPVPPRAALSRSAACCATAHG